MHATAVLTVLLLSTACLASAATAPAQTTDEQTTLNLHNTYRAQHGADALVWDPKLAQQSAAFVSKCQFRMETGLAVGQNMGVSSSLDTAGQTAAMTQMWYDSGKNYNWNNPGFQMNAGQFTQLVWKATKRIGCAARACNNIAGFGQAGTLVVCRYSPAGNVQGGFQQNVLPAARSGH